MIVGLSKPSSGHIEISGFDIQREYVEAMRHVGCIIEGPDMYGNMSGMRNLEMLSTMGTKVDRRDIDDLVELVGLSRRIHDKVRVYSMGMQQRLGLAAALLHQPKLLVLDEPNNGLDPQGIYEFRGIMKRLAAEGVSILFSSHHIGEVQLTCDKVAIINDGEIIKSAGVNELLQYREVIWKTSDPIRTMSILGQELQSVSIHDGIVSGIVGEEQLMPINRRLFEAGIDILQVMQKEKSLEELFLELTEYNSIT